MAHPITAFTNDIITETNFILPELPTIVLPARTLSHSITGAITNVNKELPAALDDHLSIRMRQVAQEIADEVTRQMYVISFLIFCSVTGTQDLVVWKKMLIGDSSMHTPNLVDIYIYMRMPRLGSQLSCPTRAIGWMASHPKKYMKPMVSGWYAAAIHFSLVSQVIKSMN